MTKDEVQALLATSKSANSKFTILGKCLAANKLDWLNELYPDLPKQEQLYLYVNGLSKPPICNHCSAPVNFKNYTRGYTKSCSISCARKHDQQVNGAAINAKMKATVQERYQISSTWQLPHAIENQKAAAQALRGSTRKPEDLAKIRVTNLAKYGHENPSLSEEVRRKITTTMNAKYGGYYIGQHGSLHRREAWISKMQKARRAKDRAT